MSCKGLGFGKFGGFRVIALEFGVMAAFFSRQWTTCHLLEDRQLMYVVLLTSE